MRRLKFINIFATLLIVLGSALFIAPSGSVSASSHREAPLISQDPSADGTDVYAFVSPDMTDTVTLIADYIPLQQPAAGPNFFPFGTDVDYEINVDTTGCTFANITYRFRFNTTRQNNNTFLYNTGVVTSLTDPDLNVRQTYSLEKLTRTTSADCSTVSLVSVESLVANAPVPPANIGPRSTPDYDSLAAAAVTTLGGNQGKVFAGSRDDPFFVDLGSAFDLLGLRPLNAAHIIPLAAAPGVDGVAGYNVNTLALQVPISTLGLTNGVMGVWSDSKRMSMSVLNGNGTKTDSGSLVRVSRLGMPLVNEVVIPLADKDKWNSTNPTTDAQFGSYVLNPEIVGLINYLYPPVVDAPTTGRTDLVSVFLTGVQGLNQLPNINASEMIRLNTTIAPAANPDRLGVLAGDFAGFPNGRRLTDDVADIELRALACAYGAVGTVGPCDSATYNVAPNNALTDGVDANDVPFTGTFPYVASPHQGYEATPPEDGITTSVKTGGAALVLGAGLFFFYIKRKKSVDAK